MKTKIHSLQCPASWTGFSAARTGKFYQLYVKADAPLRRVGASAPSPITR